MLIHSVSVHFKFAILIPFIPLKLHYILITLHSSGKSTYLVVHGGGNLMGPSMMDGLPPLAEILWAHP
jgi:hypothetical protein